MNEINRLVCKECDWVIWSICNDLPQHISDDWIHICALWNRKKKKKEIISNMLIAMKEAPAEIITVC